MFKKIPIRCLANTVNLKDSKKGSRLHNFVFPDTSILHLNVLLHSNKNYVASHRTRLYTFVTDPVLISHSKVASTRTTGISVLEGLSIQALVFKILVKLFGITFLLVLVKSHAQGKGTLKLS